MEKEGNKKGETQWIRKRKVLKKKREKRKEMEKEGSKKGETQWIR